MSEPALDPLSEEALVQATDHHLRFLELWTRDLPTKVANVDLVQCLNYELIQLLNHAYLLQYLPHEEEAQP